MLTPRGSPFGERQNPVISNDRRVLFYLPHEW
jgi:hypothetical protein